MTTEKFLEQNKTLTKFIQIYCDSKHSDLQKKDGNLSLNYNKKELQTLKYTLCSECEDMLIYANKRLQNCPHEIKPKCRKCPKPCYERDRWKMMAKIMRTSGMKLGLIKIKNIFKKNNI